LPWKSYLEMSGILGWSPTEFWAATYPELLFSFRGWQKSQGIENNPPLTREELNEMIKKHG